MSDYPENLKYTPEHEWVRSGNESIVRVGITEYAAEQLGDIVFASLPTVGETFSAGDACGELESTKSVSDIFAPVAGTISAVNTTLDGNPETVNADPYGEGWLVRIRLSDPSEVDSLLEPDAYKQHLAEQ